MRLRLLHEAELPLGNRAKVTIDRAAAAAKGKGIGGRRKRSIHDWSPTLRALGKYVHPTTGNLLWCVIKWDANGAGTGPMNSAQKADFEKIKPIIMQQSTNRDRVRKWRELQPAAFELAFREYDDDLIGNVTEIPDDLDVVTFKPDVEFDQRGEPVTPTSKPATPEVPVPPPTAPATPAAPSAPVSPPPPVAPKPPVTAPETTSKVPGGKPPVQPPGKPPTQQSGAEKAGKKPPELKIDAPPTQEKTVGEPKPSPAPGFKPSSSQKRQQKAAADQGAGKGGALSWLWRGMKNVGAAARRFFKPKN